MRDGDNQAYKVILVFSIRALLGITLSHEGIFGHAYLDFPAKRGLEIIRSLVSQKNSLLLTLTCMELSY